MKKLTIKDVAKKCGYSVATVSNVINGIEKCTPETKEKIQKVIKDLDFEVDYSAKALATKKSNLIALILPTYEQNGLLQDNPFYYDLLAGMDTVIRRNKNYDLIISGILDTDNKKDPDLIRWIRKRNIDGMIFAGYFDDKLINAAEDLGKPIVLIDNYNNCKKNNSLKLNIDNAHGAFLMAQYLYEKGHREIAVITSDLGKWGAIGYRYHGFLSALEKLGIKSKKANIFKSELTFQGGYDIAAQILKNKKITAVFALADITAMGFIKYAKDHDYKIPDDIAVAGFDHIKAVNFFTQDLTTIDQHAFERGAASVELLLEYFENKSFNENLIQMPLKLVEGKTV